MINYKVGIKYRLLLLCLTLLASCSSSRVSLIHQPKLLHFSTPEASGGFAEGNAIVSAAFEESEYVFGFIETDFLISSSNISNSSQESSQKGGGNLNLLFNVGLFENIDIFFDAAGTLGLKAQVFGGSELIKDKGLKLSLSAKYGRFKSNNQSYNVVEKVFDSLFNIGLDVANTETTTKLFDISANIGYRYNPNHLTYIYTFMSTNDFTGRLWSDREGIDRTVKASSETFGILLGYQYSTDTDFFYIVEAGAAKTSWSNRDNVWSFPFGLSYGRAW